MSSGAEFFDDSTRSSPPRARRLASTESHDDRLLSCATLRRVASANDARARSSTNSIRLLAGVMLAWCVAGIPMLVFVRGSNVDRLLSSVGLAWVASCFGWIFVRAGRADGFPSEARLSVAILLAIGGHFLTVSLGVCSAYVAIPSLCLLLYAFGAPITHAGVVYLVVAVIHAILGILAATRVISSTGFLEPFPREAQSILLEVGWVELVYATALGLGSVVKHQVDLLMAQLEQSVRTAAQRDALLVEAHAEIDRAARLGGPGRFTGMTLGSFDLGDVIGRGGMGEVYAAIHRADGSEAAVKVLRLDSVDDTDCARRFEREARIVERLESRFVVTVLEIGNRDAAVPYIAMERLRGDDLAAVLRSRGTMPLAEVRTLVREVAAGLACAHAAGVVHRDLKPHNIFHAEVATKRRVWKVLDFGVSKLIASGADATLTANRVIGTPQYMAPEQALGARDVDHRADVHALAAIAYRALTGRIPFGRSAVAQQLVAVAQLIPDDPRGLVQMPEDVALVLRIGLAKSADDRFPSANELARTFADASNENLSAAWREHARKLIAAEPWGARLRTDTPTPLKCDWGTPLGVWSRGDGSD